MSNHKTLTGILFADWNSNDNLQVRLSLVLFRLCQILHGNSGLSKIIFFIFFFIYKVVVVWLFHFDIPVNLSVGTNLTIHHGFGLVINPDAIIGRRVILRQGVTIGNRRAGGGSPVIGDDVEFGANSLVLGNVIVGDRAKIGAGAVVLTDVPEGCVAVGNPARLIGKV